MIDGENKQQVEKLANQLADVVRNKL
jgi:hypothetical protein